MLGLAVSAGASTTRLTGAPWGNVEGVEDLLSSPGNAGSIASFLDW